MSSLRSRTTPLCTVLVCAAHLIGACSGGGSSSHPADAGEHEAEADAMQPEAEPDATQHDAEPDAALPSQGCDAASGYAPGTSASELMHQGAVRSFRVHVPAGYAPTKPAPLLLMFHGGGGSGRQFEQASSRMDPVAERENFVAVYPDGSGVLKTWNGPGCCGYAVQNNVDDVGFVTALLDQLERTLCIDRRRIFASGMSNGAILSHRLGCELSARIAAIAPVAGTDLTTQCNPTRPVAVLQIHGSADGHVPWNGGEGCGPAGVAFTSVPTSIEHWRTRNGCTQTTSPYFSQGEGQCVRSAGCSSGADVVLCTIQGGGHNWPGGEPPADLTPCPGNGFQSASFSASEVVWSFFADHPMPVR